MAQEDSGNNTPVDQIERHKESLKKKKPKNVPKTDECCSKLLAKFQQSNDMLEEIISYNNEFLKRSKSMSKTINAISNGIKDLNHTLVAHFNSQAQTSVQTNKLMEELADTSVFDSSVLDTDGFVGMTENMSDALNDYYDSSKETFDSFSEDFKGASDTIVRVVDDIGDFTDELRSIADEPEIMTSGSMSGDASFAIEEMNANIIEMADDTNKTKMMMSDIHDWIGDIWQNLTNQKNKKQGKTGESLNKKDGKDKDAKKTSLLAKAAGVAATAVSAVAKGAVWLGDKALGAITGSAKKLWEATKTAWQETKNAYGALKTSLAPIWDRSKEMMKNVWDRSKEVMSSVWDKSKEIMSAIKNKAQALTQPTVDKVKGYATSLSDQVKAFFIGVGDKLKGFFKPFIDTAAKILKPITNTFSKIMKPIMSVIKPIMKMTGKVGGPVLKFFFKIAKAFGKLGLKAVPFIGQIWMVVDALWDFAKGFGDEGASEITGKSKETLTILDKFKTGLSSMISGILFGLVDKKVIFDYIDGISNDILKFIPDSWKEMGSKFMAFFDFSDKDSFLFKTWDKAKSVFSGIVDFLAPIWEEVKSFGKTVVEMLPNTYRTIFNNLSEWFTGAIPKAEAIWESIKKFGTDMYDTVTGFFTKIGDWYKNLNIVDQTVAKIEDFNMMISNKIMGFLKSIFDILPKSVKDFLSNSALRLSNSVVNAWSAVKGKVGLSSNDVKPKNISTAKATLLPQAVNTKTARNMDSERAQQRKPKEVQSGNKTVVVQNNNGGNSTTPIVRTVNTGRTDINRSIGRGAQFSF